MTSAWPEFPFAHASTWRRCTALAVSVTAIALDWTVMRTPELGPSWWRTGLGLGSLALLVLLGGDARSMALRLRPLPDTRFWVRATLWISAAVLVLLGVSIAIASMRGTWLVPPVPDLPSLWGFAWFGCVHAPITEELLYRAVLCAPLAMLIGPWGTVLVSAIVFATLHELWDKLEWTHAFAGALKAWIYLRSGCLWLVIALHAFFNAWGLAVLFAQFQLGAR